MKNTIEHMINIINENSDWECHITESSKISLISRWYPKYRYFNTIEKAYKYVFGHEYEGEF